MFLKCSYIVQERVRSSKWSNVILSMLFAIEQSLQYSYNNCSSIYQSIVVYYYRVSFNSAGQVDILDRLAILACLTISSNNNICITTISHYNNHLNNISSHLKLLLLSPSMDAPFIHTSGWYYIGWYYIGLCKLAFVFSNFWSF